MLSKAAGAINKPKVTGFMFPISREEDIERLEAAVRCDSDIRAQYVEYLSVTKPLRQGVGQVFNKYFTDEAMTNYNWHGLDRAQYPRTPKKGMQMYDIFYGCMIGRFVTSGSTRIMMNIGFDLFQMHGKVTDSITKHLSSRFRKQFII
nr:uncharacterized protein LOC115264263 [Aedes albopictus]